MVHDFSFELLLQSSKMTLIIDMNVYSFCAAFLFPLGTRFILLGLNKD